MTARNRYTFEPTEAGRHLSGRPTRDTKPELTLRRALHASGFRFRLHRRLDRGCTPDLVLPKYHLAVWVDGCFWHGHEHVRPVTRGPNVAAWRAKLKENRRRDSVAIDRARALGWVPLRVWECEIRDDLPRVLARIQGEALRHG